MTVAARTAPAIRCCVRAAREVVDCVVLAAVLHDGKHFIGQNNELNWQPFAGWLKTRLRTFYYAGIGGVSRFRHWKDYGKSLKGLYTCKLQVKISLLDPGPLEFDSAPGNEATCGQRRHELSPKRIKRGIRFVRSCSRSSNPMRLTYHCTMDCGCDRISITQFH